MQKVIFAQFYQNTYIMPKRVQRIERKQVRKVKRSVRREKIEKGAKRAGKKIVKGLKKTKILSTGLNIAAAPLGAAIGVATGQPLAGKVGAVGIRLGAKKLRQAGFGQSANNPKIKVDRESGAIGVHGLYSDESKQAAKRMAKEPVKLIVV